ncbi:hypothetical protein ACOME3_009445 [Neoechinorhynchus agilis]
MFDASRICRDEDVLEDSSEDDCSQVKRCFAKSAIELQRARLQRLMSRPDQEVVIPELNVDKKLPRAFEPHEFVRNVMGASAGAGSGEFDIYRGCRRRERIRQQFIFRQEKMRQLDEQFKAKVDAAREVYEKKTEKKRKKRQRLKEKKKQNRNCS